MRKYTTTFHLFINCRVSYGMGLSKIPFAISITKVNGVPVPTIIPHNTKTSLLSMMIVSKLYCLLNSFGFLNWQGLKEKQIKKILNFIVTILFRKFLEE